MYLSVFKAKEIIEKPVSVLVNGKSKEMGFSYMYQFLEYNIY